MRKIYSVLFFVLILIAGKSYSQINYNFTAAQGAYTSLPVGATTATLSAIDPAVPSVTDEGFANITLPFSFRYNGLNNYTIIRACTNGFAAFGTAFALNANNSYWDNNLTSGPSTINATTGAYNPSGNAARRPIIAPFWGDLDLASIRYQTTGSAPNRVFTLQWDQVKFDFQATAPVLSFQLKLYETTNVIEFVYKQEATAPSANAIASIGLTAAGTGINNFLSLQDVSSAPAVSTEVEESQLFDVPVDGQVYRFTPQACLIPTSLAISNQAPTSATFGWTAPLGATGYEYAVSTTNTPPGSGTATTSTSANITNLTPGSVYYFFVRNSCGSGSFSNWAQKNFIPCTTNTAPANGATSVQSPPTISWTAVEGATGYLVMLSEDGGATYNAIGSVPSPRTSATLTALAYAKQYFFYVRPIARTEVSTTNCVSNATSFTTMVKPAAPANDSCAGAAFVSFIAVNGTTYGATQSDSAVSCDPGNIPAGDANDDVWYKFVALNTGTGTITLSNTSSYFDGVMEAYSGACGALTSIGCADSTGSGQNEVLTLQNLQAGQKYYVRVYNYLPEGSEGNFTLLAGGPALPITLSSFKGERVGSKSLLTWTTAVEQNNKGFELQRSADGKNFSRIAFVESKANGGNSNTTLHYSFEDFKPFGGTNYYRLKQVDKDDKATFSSIVMLRGLKTGALQINTLYPNPAITRLNMVISSPANDKISIIVTDLAGKVISKNAAEVIGGDNNLSINVANLPSGSYLVKALCANGCETAVSKFVKQ